MTTRRIKQLQGAQKGAQTRARKARRIRKYLRAAALIEKGQLLSAGCCAALIHIDALKETRVMEDVFVDRVANPVQRSGYWMSEYGEQFSHCGANPEIEDRRVLALCFMAALISRGDA